MKIGVNLLYAHTGIGGSWNYIDYLLNAVAKFDSENQYICYVTDRSRNLVPCSTRFREVRFGTMAQARLTRVVIENSILQRLAASHQLDVMHWFANTNALYNSVPSVVTVHDLQAYSGHHQFNAIKRIYLQIMMRYAVRTAKALIAVSKATADDLVRVLSANCCKIHVLPVVVDNLFQPATKEAITRFRSKYALPDKFWLYVANTYPHKNHRALLSAYKSLLTKEPDSWPLVLRGDSSTTAERQSLLELARLFEVDHKIIWLPRIPRAQMPLLYSSATALVFPSLYEGGGIPVLEAMACELPVVASSIPPVKEFAAEAAVYFNPRQPDDIMETMWRFQSQPDERDHHTQLGLKRIRSHRPESIVPRLLHIYQNYGLVR